MSTVTPPPPPTPSTPPAVLPTDLPDPGLGATIRSEFTKIRTARAPRRNLILGAILGIGLSALTAFAVGATFSEWGLEDQADFDPVLFSFNGSILTAIFYVAVGARLATSEYDSDMMRLTLAVTPRRSRVVAAKAIVTAVATWVFGALAMVGMVVASQAIFAAYDLETTGVFDSTVLRSLGTIMLMLPLFPLLALSAGLLFRSTAPTITVSLLLLLGPGFFGALLPTWWQENILSLFPGSASDAVSIGHLADSAMYHSLPVAAVLSVLWLIGPLVVATIVLDRRDA